MIRPSSVLAHDVLVAHLNHLRAKVKERALRLWREVQGGDTLSASLEICNKTTRRRITKLL